MKYIFFMKIFENIFYMCLFDAYNRPVIIIMKFYTRLGYLWERGYLGFPDFDGSTVKYGWESYIIYLFNIIINLNMY